MVLAREFALSSGFSGITYSNGARLLLAGPAIYRGSTPSAAGPFHSELSVTIQPPDPGVKSPDGIEATRGSDLHDSDLLLVFRTPVAELANRNERRVSVLVDDSGASAVYVFEGSLLTTRGGAAGAGSSKHASPPSHGRLPSGERAYFRHFSGAERASSVQRLHRY